MYKRLLIALGLLIVSSVALGQAYRWVDASGVVHYSDRPEPGAEEIQLSNSTPRAGGVTPTARRSSESAEVDERPQQPDGYTSLEIADPGAEQTLWNIGGVLNVTLNLTPALQSGDRIRVYFDGEPRAVSGTTFRIPEVYRGEHNIQAEVVDPRGELLIRSQTTRFYVQQTSIRN